MSPHPPKPPLPGAISKRGGAEWKEGFLSINIYIKFTNLYQLVNRVFLPAVSQLVGVPIRVKFAGVGEVMRSATFQN